MSQNKLDPMIELNEREERLAGHTVFWRRGVLWMFLAYSALGTAWGIISLILDFRDLFMHPALYMTGMNLAAFVFAAARLGYMARVEAGDAKKDILVFVFCAAALYLLATSRTVDLELIHLLVSMLFYIGGVFLYPFAHRLDTGSWRADMLLVIAVFAGIAALIWFVWLAPNLR